MQKTSRVSVIVTFGAFALTDETAGLSSDSEGEEQSKNSNVTVLSKDPDGYPILPDPANMSGRERQRVCREFLRQVLIFDLPPRKKAVSVPWGMVQDRFSDAFDKSSCFPSPEWRKIKDPSKMEEVDVAQLLTFWHTKQQVENCPRPVRFSSQVIDQKKGRQGKKRRAQIQQQLETIDEPATTDTTVSGMEGTILTSLTMKQDRNGLSSLPEASENGDQSCLVSLLVSGST